MKRKPLSEQAQKSLARYLRRRFSKTVLPHVLERISDEELVDHYFLDAERKVRSLSKKASSACSSLRIEV